MENQTREIFVIVKTFRDGKNCAYEHKVNETTTIGELSQLCDDLIIVHVGRKPDVNARICEIEKGSNIIFHGVVRKTN
jgi:hypothetical protein